MIPTMILFGAIAGRWWKSALVIGTALWVALLYFDGTIAAYQVPATALFGLANTAVGVAIHQAFLALVRRMHGHPAGTGTRM